MSSDAPNNTHSMTFGDHLEALRPHLVRGASVILVLVVVAFCCKTILVDGVLFAPIAEWFPTNRLLNYIGEAAGLGSLAPSREAFELVSTTMAGQFNLHLAISVTAAFVVGFPFLLWELWRFIRPALTDGEARGCRHFVGYVTLGFFAGLAFGFFIVTPFSIAFLTQYRVSDLVVNMIDVNSYLSTVINVSLACAVLFQLPLLVHFLTRMGVITPDLLRHYRRHALVGLAILAAIITPPDAFSMVMVLMPLYGLYEYSIRVSARTMMRRIMNKATEE